MKYIATLIAVLPLTLLIVCTSPPVNAEGQERAEELPEVPVKDTEREAYSTLPQLFHAKKITKCQKLFIVHENSAPIYFKENTPHTKTPLFILVKVLRH